MVVAVIIWKNEAESLTLTVLGYLEVCISFLGRKQEKYRESKEISFISFPFPSNSSFPSILSPGISHLDSALLDMSLISLSLSLLPHKNVLKCWEHGHPHSIYGSVSFVFLVIDARFLKTMKPTPRSQRIFFKRILGSWRTSEILPASIGPGEDCFGYGTLTALETV